MSIALHILDALQRFCEDLPKLVLSNIGEYILKLFYVDV
jgi:hypothetical protein